MLCFSGCFSFVHLPRLHLDLKKSHSAVCLEFVIQPSYLAFNYFYFNNNVCSLNVELLVS
jgi:hypothetical protein